MTPGGSQRSSSIYLRRNLAQIFNPHSLFNDAIRNTVSNGKFPDLINNEPCGRNRLWSSLRQNAGTFLPRIMKATTRVSQTWSTLSTDWSANVSDWNFDEIQIKHLVYLKKKTPSQWWGGLRRGSGAARLLGLLVRIPSGGMDVCLRRADHSSRGFLQSVVCVCVCVCVWSDATIIFYIYYH